MTIKLAVKKREANAKNLRAEGQLPGVVYGPKQEAITLSVDHKEFSRIFDEAGEATIIELEGLDDNLEVLIHDTTYDPVKGGIIHVDFYAIERGKEMTTNVPLEFINEAPVEKLGATVNKILHEVEVTCRPSDLPSHLDIDLSVLTDQESHILVSDIKLPGGVKIENNPEDMVANVSAAREEEPEVTEAPDMNAIEVESKGKEDSEEEK